MGDRHDGAAAGPLLAEQEHQLAPGGGVLDEPTFGQDTATWRELVLLLAEERARGCSVVTVTHDADLVAVLADDRLRTGAPA